MNIKLLGCLSVLLLCPWRLIMSILFIIFILIITSYFCQSLQHRLNNANYNMITDNITSKRSNEQDYLTNSIVPYFDLDISSRTNIIITNEDLFANSRDALIEKLENNVDKKTGYMIFVITRPDSDGEDEKKDVNEKLTLYTKSVVVKKYNYNITVYYTVNHFSNVRYFSQTVDNGGVQSEHYITYDTQSEFYVQHTENDIERNDEAELLIKSKIAAAQIKTNHILALQLPNSVDAFYELISKYKNYYVVNVDKYAQMFKKLDFNKNESVDSSGSMGTLSKKVIKEIVTKNTFPQLKNSTTNTIIYFPRLDAHFTYYIPKLAEKTWRFVTDMIWSSEDKNNTYNKKTFVDQTNKIPQKLACFYRLYLSDDIFLFSHNQKNACFVFVDDVHVPFVRISFLVN